MKNKNRKTFLEEKDENMIKSKKWNNQKRKCGIETTIALTITPTPKPFLKLLNISHTQAT